MGIEPNVQETVFIGLGSNIGDGRRTLLQAWKEIGKCERVSIEAISSPYLSAPVDMQSSNWFTNAVGRLVTKKSPIELLDQLLGIESDFGRRRDNAVQGYQDRTLDLDILYFGDSVIESDRLHIPHPQLSGRLFVLRPLVEIAPEWRDPADNLTPAEKLEELEARMSTGLVARQEINKAEWDGGGIATS